jgi:hypothetical protein
MTPDNDLILQINDILHPNLWCQGNKTSMQFNLGSFPLDFNAQVWANKYE